MRVLFRAEGVGGSMVEILPSFCNIPDSDNMVLSRETRNPVFAGLSGENRCFAITTNLSSGESS